MVFTRLPFRMLVLERRNPSIVVHRTSFCEVAKSHSIPGCFLFSRLAVCRSRQSTKFYKSFRCEGGGYGFE
jgi:hypothetical protein